MVVLAATGIACSNSSNSPTQEPAGILSQQTRVPAEYLVSLAPGTDPKAIAEQYGRFQIKRTQSLGRDVYLVILVEDPGPEKMKELGARSVHIKAVQPNFTYRANVPGNAQ